jgi:hypothetical protein
LYVDCSPQTNSRLAILMKSSDERSREVAIAAPDYFGQGPEQLAEGQATLSTYLRF